MTNAHQQSNFTTHKTLHVMYFELREVILVLGEKLVGHLANFVEREHRSGERIVADRPVDSHRIAR